MSTMPLQRPATSEQVVATPPLFLEALKVRLGIEDFAWDLAALADNTVAPRGFYSPEENSLDQPWHLHAGWLWLNPPFSDITPWVQKAWDESRQGATIAVLVPASTGANWWSHHVLGKAYVTFLNGRLTFVGHTAPYPKDLALLLYAPFLEGGACWWRWKV